MKKLLLILMPILLFAACAKGNDKDKEIKQVQPTTASTTEKHTIQDYYPFKENIKMVYSGTGNEFADKDIYVDFLNENRIQLRTTNTGTETVQVLENKDGELRKLYSKGESFYKENMISILNDKPEILLKEPLVKGTSWTLPDGKKRFISGIDVDVDTPSGKYKALEVTTESGSDITKDYYALNVGNIKTIVKSNNLEVTSSLKEVVKDTKYKQFISFYYPDFLNGRIVFIKKEVSLGTNEEVKAVLEKQYKEDLSKDIVHLLGSNTKINKLSLNEKEGTVILDLTKSFVKELNAGSSFEQDALQSLANTIGNYYHVNKVYISLDGQPYASGHIALNPGEFFKVDTKDTIEYKKNE